MRQLDHAVYRVQGWLNNRWLTLWAGKSYAYAKQFIGWYRTGYPQDEFRITVGNR